MHTLPEPGIIKTVVETLLKPFTLIFNPIAERIGNRFRRKPKLYIHIHPVTSIWSYAWGGANQSPMMQVRFDADITNDSDHEAVLILDAYVEGTKSTLPFTSHIEIPSATTALRQVVGVFSAPVVGEGGKDFTGRIILVDQFKRKHPCDKTTFEWVGTTEPPKIATRS
jgi:hypothetical protein